MIANGGGFLVFLYTYGVISPWRNYVVCLWWATLSYTVWFVHDELHCMVCPWWVTLSYTVWFVHDELHWVTLYGLSMMSYTELHCMVCPWWVTLSYTELHCMVCPWWATLSYTELHCMVCPWWVTLSYTVWFVHDELHWVTLYGLSMMSYTELHCMVCVTWVMMNIETYVSGFVKSMTPRSAGKLCCWIRTQTTMMFIRINAHSRIKPTTQNLEIYRLDQTSKYRQDWSHKSCSYINQMKHINIDDATNLNLTKLIIRV